MPYKVGVLNVNIDTPTQAPDEGWQDDDNLTDHFLGVVLFQQYNLKKGLELFGERAKEATTKELQQIYDFGTYIRQDAKLLCRDINQRLCQNLCLWLKHVHVQGGVSREHFLDM